MTLKNAGTFACCSLMIAIAAHAADKKIKKSELPAAVQKTVDEQSKGATVGGYSTEQDKGQTLYEVQLKVNGHSKDVSMDSSGKVMEVEEEVGFAELSPEVQQGLKAAAAKGKLGKVESLTKGGKLVAYEAVVVTGGKRSEVQVGPDGKKLKQTE
jgi:hypothetical protein